MRSVMYGTVAALLAAGTVSAQGITGGASNPTKVDPGVSGPQDSIGTAGESPTKQMMEAGKLGGGKGSGKDSSGASGTGNDGASPNDGRRTGSAAPGVRPADETRGGQQK